MGYFELFLLSDIIYTNSYEIRIKTSGIKKFELSLFIDNLSP